ncbi:hypothetical protein BGZ51_009743 [Haplosporangium sp. Z 767]|nr:hypothetical protein BGZ50_009841 [Haplosporangium sp. Z 11]KAF9176724.1 hypothetical protein BGZ51_009743 [Haplosporangium sp. Z 767]
MIEPGLQPKPDEDSIENQLRFERWQVSREQYFAEDEEEWNYFAARHHALINKISEKKHDGAGYSKPVMSHGYNYGIEIVQPEHPIDQFTGHGMTSLAEENIFKHVDDLISA